MTTLMGNAGNTNSNQVSLTATPVTTSNDVYDAYVNFLKKPGSLVVADEAPPEGAAHICRKVRHRYYYVPVEFRDDFFQLALATTAQRGTTIQSTDPFFTVALNEPVTNIDNPDPGTGRVLIFDVDKQGIPQDTGSLVLDDDTNGTRFSIVAQTIPATTGSATTVNANKLVVYVPNQPVDLRLDEKGSNVPDGGKSLFYLSDKNDKLSFYVTDSESRTYKRIREDDTSLTDDKKREIGVLKTYIREHKLWTQPPTAKERTQVIKQVASICDYPLNPDQKLFMPLPKTAKLHLLNNTPKPRADSGPSRTDALLQGILFNQNRLAQ